jgi:hypothetical protein
MPFTTFHSIIESPRPRSETIAFRPKVRMRTINLHRRLTWSVSDTYGTGFGTDINTRSGAVSIQMD